MKHQNKKRTKHTTKQLLNVGATTLMVTGGIIPSMINAGADTTSDMDKQAKRVWTKNTAEQVRNQVSQQGAHGDLGSYVVQWGDTLDALAEANNVSSDSLVERFHIQDKNKLIAGYKLSAQGAAQAKNAAPIAAPTGASQGVASAPVQVGSTTDSQMTSTQDSQSNATSQENSTSTSTSVANEQSTSAAQAVATNQPTTSNSQLMVNTNTESQVGGEVNQVSSVVNSTDLGTSRTQSLSIVNSANQSMTTSTNEMAKKASSTAQVAPVANSQAQKQQLTVSASTAPVAQNSTTDQNDNHRVDNDKLINWFQSRQGKLTYDMDGSRNGADGTADCSGAMTEALYEAGASKPAYMYNTETLHDYLQSNGYKLIAENQSWDAQRGDVVIWGQKGASAGAAGHVQVITSNDPNAKTTSVNYSTGGAKGTAVTETNYDQYYAATAKATGQNPYTYVYRQQ